MQNNHLPSPHVAQTTTSDDDLPLLPHKQHRSARQSTSIIIHIIIISLCTTYYRKYYNRIKPQYNEVLNETIQCTTRSQHTTVHLYQHAYITPGSQPSDICSPRLAWSRKKFTDECCQELRNISTICLRQVSRQSTQDQQTHYFKLQLQFNLFFLSKTTDTCFTFVGINAA